MEKKNKSSCLEKLPKVDGIEVCKKLKFTGKIMYQKILYSN